MQTIGFPFFLTPSLVRLRRCTGSEVRLMDCAKVNLPPNSTWSNCNCGLALSISCTNSSSGGGGAQMVDGEL